MKICGLGRKASNWLIGLWLVGILAACAFGVVAALFAGLVYHIRFYRPEMGFTSTPTFYPTFGIGSLVAFFLEYRYLWLPQRNSFMNGLRRLGR